MALAQLLAGVAGEEKVGRPSWIKAGADAVRPAGRGVNAEAVDLVVCMRKQTGRGCLARPAATAQQGTLGLCAPRLGGVNAPIAQPMRSQGTGKAPSPRESAGGRFGKKHHTCSAPRSACSFLARASPALIWINRTPSEIRCHRRCAPTNACLRGWSCSDGALEGQCAEARHLVSAFSEQPRWHQLTLLTREDSSSSELHKLGRESYCVSNRLHHVNQRCFRVGSEELGGWFREHRSTNQRKSGRLAAVYSEKMGG
jgi:hypothetical protein